MSKNERVVVIDCDECVMQGTDACTDCVVTFVCGDHENQRSGALVLDLAEARAVRLLTSAGLVPTLRHRAPA